MVYKTMKIPLPRCFLLLSAALFLVLLSGAFLNASAIPKSPASGAKKNIARARPDSIPSWLDTIPPRVTSFPAKRYHPGIVLVTLKASKPSFIWYAVASSAKTETYRKPVPLIRQGRHTVYFYGEDYVGNRSKLDSAVYIIDSRPPLLSIKPDPGRFRRPVTVRLMVNKPCRFFTQARSGDSSLVPCQDSLRVTASFSGHITVIDSAGNRTTSERVAYIIDS
ncbi:MAG: hypothetical protein PHC61_19130, partial [Chitinivibrionales bacterium]|nr:hypothetical protein [Chitinivibrionales bacterium]